MAVIVQKYGGSSVADLGKLKRVAARIRDAREAGHDVVAVVSAMGNTTSELLALARQVSAAPDRRELDMLVSVGERISMALLAMALGELGVPARSLTGSQSGIVTDEAHADAKVVEVRPARLRQVLDQGCVAIVAGFQGVSREREVTTLGRGGSDTTAVVLAAALAAEYCEICSDVDGIWSADPRVVPTAVKVDELALDEALALARGGAKVLFEDAVQYARDHGVAIRAVSTFGPGSGTRLTPERHLRDLAVAVTGDTALVRVDGAFDVAAARAGGARVRRRIGDVVFLDLRNAHGGVDLGRPVGLVTAVGSGVGESGAVAAGAAGALADAGVAVELWGSEGDVVWFQVARDACDDGVRAVHGAVVNTPRSRPGAGR